MTEDAELPAASLLPLGRPGTRVVVAGTGTHPTGSGLPNVPSVRDTVRDLGKILVERCGLVDEELDPLVDPSPGELEAALIEAAEQATDVLLFYYVGHGLVSSGNELYLATRDTDHLTRALATKALPYSAVRDALSECRARSIVVVLDCCYAGRARGSFGTPVADALELAGLGGTYLLASTAPEEQALAPPGDKHTAFTGALITFLREGDPTAPSNLTLEDAHRYLSRFLVQRHFPAPHRQLSGRTGDLVLAPNPAAAPVILPRPPRSDSDDTAAERPCPYRGLHAFTQEDTRYFFGRRELTTALIRHVVAQSQDESLIAVVGPSGVGKSSLLRAGLLQAITDGELPIPGARTWPSFVIVPGEHPLAEIATRFAEPAGMAKETIHAELAADPLRFADILRRALRAPEGGRCVLVVDQFEEVFTACQDDGERRAFIRAVCAAAKDSEDGQHAPAVVILGMRADFDGQCLAYPELHPALDEGRFLVRPMSTAQLRDVIVKPAEVAGLRLEDGLVELLLHDLHTGADAVPALPLLSFALERTWGLRRDGAILTMAGYRDTGGIWGAVTKQADSAFHELDAVGQRAANALLLRMVRVADSTEESRRRINFAELLRQLPASEAAAMIKARDVFAKARLITVDEDTAEITHEALLRAWPTLRRWITEDRAALIQRQQVADAAEVWQRESGDRGSLYRGSRLAAVRPLLKDDGQRAALSAREQDFLRASIRAGHLRRLGVVAVVVLVLSGAVAGVVAVRQSQAAADRANILLSQQVAAQADITRVSDPAAALQLSLAAFQISPTSEARAALYTAAVTPYPIPLRKQAGTILNLTYSPDGRVLASADDKKTVWLWDTSDPHHPTEAATLSVEGKAAIAFSPDGHLLAVHGAQNLQLWDVTDPRRPTRKAAVTSATKIAYSVAFSPDGRTLAAGSDDATVRLWNVTDPARPVADRQLRTGTPNVTSVAFRPDGHTVATASNGGRVQLWDVTLVQPAIVSALEVKSAWSVAFSPDGKLLAAGGVRGTLNMWDVSDLRSPNPMNLAVNELDGADIFSVAFSRDGGTFVATSSSGTVYRMRFSSTLGSKELLDLGPFRSGVSLYSVALSPDNLTLATGGDDGVVRVWTTPGPAFIGHSLSSAAGGGAPGSVFGADGRVLVTNDPDGSAQLWDVANPRQPVLAASLPEPWVNGAFLSDGRTLVTLAKGGSSVGLWDASDPRRPVVKSTFPAAHPGKSVSVKASLDNHLLVLHNEAENVIHLWDIADLGHPVETATVTAPGGVQGFGLHNRGALLITFDDSTVIHLWDVSDPHHPGESTAVPDSSDSWLVGTSKGLLAAGGTRRSHTELWNVTDPRHPISKNDKTIPTADEFQFIDDGQVLVTSANSARTLRFWDISRPDQPLPRASVPADGNIRQLYVSDDDRVLAAVMYGDQVRIFDVKSPSDISERKLRLTGTDLEFSPDNHTVAVNQHDPNYGFGLWLWELNADRLYRDLCSSSGNTMAPDEWARLVPNHPYQQPCP